MALGRCAVPDSRGKMSRCHGYRSVCEIAPAAADETAAGIKLFSLSAGTRFVVEPRRARQTSGAPTADDGDRTFGGLVFGNGRDGSVRAPAHRRDEGRFAAVRAAGCGGSRLGYCG